jgi:hypothetical protein
MLGGVEEVTVTHCESSFVVHAKTKNLLSRECTRMNTNSFIAIFEHKPLEMWLGSKV